MKRTITNYVNDSQEFVGIEIDKSTVTIHLPKFLENRLIHFQNDILSFLKTIKYAKDVENKIINGSDLNKDVWPIDSYIWLIKDYMENGLLKNMDLKYLKNKPGRIIWKKTLNQDPIITDGNIVFDKLITSKQLYSNDILSYIHKYCLMISNERIGWLFPSLILEPLDEISISLNEMKHYTRRASTHTFNDMNSFRLKNMLTVLNGVDNLNNQLEHFSYGTKNYNYSFEFMVDKIFGGIRKEIKKKYNPRSFWKIRDEIYSKSVLKPDSIVFKSDIIFLIDSKYYQFGITNLIAHLPETESIAKQIVYYEELKMHYPTKKIINIFFLPFNEKRSEINMGHNHILHFGNAYPSWKKTTDSNHEFKISGYFIDLKFLIDNHTKKHIDISDYVNDL